MSHWRILLAVLLIGPGTAWSHQDSQGAGPDASDAQVSSAETIDAVSIAPASEAAPADISASTPDATVGGKLGVNASSENAGEIENLIPADAASPERPATAHEHGAPVEPTPAESESATYRRPRPSSRGRRVEHPTRTAAHQGRAVDEEAVAPGTAEPVTTQPRQPQFDEQGRQLLKITVMAIRGAESAVQKWQPTADYLTEHVPGYHFIIEPLDFVGIRAAMANGTVDFVLTNPGMYVEFESRYGVRRITTLKNLRLGAPYTEFGAVIFKRADRNDILNIKDLKGKRFATVDESAFGGWQMAWRQFLELGLDPYRDLGELYSVGTHDKVVYEVLEGRADGGNVRTDTLERMDQEGKVEIKDFAPIYPSCAESPVSFRAGMDSAGRRSRPLVV